MFIGDIKNISNLILVHIVIFNLKMEDLRWKNFYQCIYVPN